MENSLIVSGNITPGPIKAVARFAAAILTENPANTFSKGRLIITTKQ